MVYLVYVIGVVFFFYICIKIIIIIYVYILYMLNGGLKCLEWGCKLCSL